VSETPAKAGFQFERSFFIVPAGSRFVNESGLRLRPAQLFMHWFIGRQVVEI
jgi:hypothetical protein